MFKKIFKTPLIYLVFSIFSLLFIGINYISAQYEFEFVKLFSASSTAFVETVTDKIGGTHRIVNMSSNSYFVPNKTYPELGSFLANSPRYIFYSRCGDSICDIITEDPDNCPVDCATIKGIYKYCGDGNCSTKESCDGYSSFSKFISCEALPSEGENYFNCPQDCAEPLVRGCGVCGIANDQICPNQCSSNEISLTNCVKEESTNYVNFNTSWISNGMTVSGFSINDDAINLIPNPGSWACDPGLGTACPAGSYCPATGIILSSSYSCPAGYYCPKGTMIPQICPPRTYSTGGASTCAICPNYTFSAPGAIAASGTNGCYSMVVCGDGNCNSSPPYNETPRNCPIDCSIIGDGMCTGLESMDPASAYYSPQDCFCGNGSCDRGESSVSCFTDCHCGNGVCDFEEDVETINNCSDCSLANTCGNGIWEPHETFSNCPADSRCGDNFCNDMIGENSSNCSADCDVCGNGICNAAKGETSYSCPIDCPRCGNGVCNTNNISFNTIDDVYMLFNAETSNNCSADCNCEDGVCDAYELDTGSCPADCGCGNGVCQTGETPTNCRYDCGACGDGVCAYHNRKIETSSNAADVNYYYYCPQDCDSSTDTRFRIIDPI